MKRAFRSIYLSPHKTVRCSHVDIYRQSVRFHVHSPLHFYTEKICMVLVNRTAELFKQGKLYYGCSGIRNRHWTNKTAPLTSIIFTVYLCIIICIITSKNIMIRAVNHLNKLFKQGQPRTMTEKRGCGQEALVKVTIRNPLISDWQMQCRS